ncbi:MAG: 3,4-dihydroxy-2-butanone-4-phosphate synthase [Rickettsiales bacterium]|nr:3,4-dihydroxy-2-butanone-4-phosphate synthase [Rickettsiales bacterium]
MTELSPIEDIIADAKAGKMFILVDDEDRENEGDLVIPAEFATPEVVNFMAMHGRGLICLPLESQQIKRLGLPKMAQHNTSRHETAFTVSIEAREGVTTGISAADRSHTILTAINPQCRQTEIATPGHVFPLEARDGGVLVRAGHTEAAVDISRMAGLNPSGVICEIMKDDGEMARLPDLLPFAEKHELKIASIADLIAYRRRTDKLVEAGIETTLQSQFGGDWSASVYTSTLEYAEHLVLKKGNPDTSKPVWVRMHAFDPLRDAMGDMFGDKTGELAKAMNKIADHGEGIVVIIREPRRTTLSDLLSLRSGDSKTRPPMLRDYGIGAQILLDLGIREMTLLSNSRSAVIGLEGYGLSISDYKSI